MNNTTYSPSSKEIVRSHLILLKFLIEEGPHTVRQIKERFKWSDRTVRDRLERIRQAGLIRELAGERGVRYAYYTHSNHKFMIKKLLKEKFPNDIAKGVMHPNLPVAISRLLGLTDNEKFRNDLNEVFAELAATMRNK